MQLLFLGWLLPSHSSRALLATPGRGRGHCSLSEPCCATTWPAPPCPPLPCPALPCAQVDGTKEKGLLSRFSVLHFPSIYHINNTETREYEGTRSLKKARSSAVGA